MSLKGPEDRLPHVLVDFQGVNPNSRMDVYKRIESAVNAFFCENRGSGRASKEPQNISGLRVLGFGVNVEGTR